MDFIYQNKKDFFTPNKNIKYLCNFSVSRLFSKFCLFVYFNKCIKYLHLTELCGTLSCLSPLADFGCLFTSINILDIYVLLSHDMYDFS